MMTLILISMVLFICILCNFLCFSNRLRKEYLREDLCEVQREHNERLERLQTCSSSLKNEVAALNHSMTGVEIEIMHLSPNTDLGREDP